MTPDKQAILRERSLKLAQIPKVQDTKTQGLRIIQFRIGNDLFGVEDSFVREISVLKDLTQLPSAPASLMGIINIRGEIVAILDLGKVMNLDDTEEELKKIVVLHNDSNIFGIAAAEISSIESLAETEMRAPLPTLAGARKRFLKGIAGVNTAVLDAEKMLEDESLKILS